MCIVFMGWTYMWRSDHPSIPLWCDGDRISACCFDMPGSVQNKQTRHDMLTSDFSMCWTPARPAVCLSLQLIFFQHARESCQSPLNQRQPSGTACHWCQFFTYCYEGLLCDRKLPPLKLMKKYLTYFARRLRHALKVCMLVIFVLLFQKLKLCNCCRKMMSFFNHTALDS